MLNLEQNAARNDIEKGLDYQRLRHEFTENLTRHYFGLNKSFASK